MVKVRIFSLLGGLWDLARVYIFFIIILNWLEDAINPSTFFLLLWLGSSSLVFSLVFFSLGFSKYEASFSVKLLIINKLLSLLSSIFFFVFAFFSFNEIGEAISIREFLLSLQLNFTKTGFILAGIILIIDFIFFCSLLLYKKQDLYMNNGVENGNLPDYSETSVEE